MVHFEKCITELLNRSGQVQVPGLGRFEYVEVSSVVKQMGNVVTPPLSTLVFCNECKSDGQDFINFFAQTEKCDLFNATTEVTSCVNRIKNDLKLNGSFYMNKLGTLMMSQNQLFFLPDEAIHFNENYFGLTDITFPQLSANMTLIPRSKQMKAPTLAKQSIKERQHKKMPAIRRTAFYAAATITAFVFLLSTLFFGNMQKQNEASVLDVYTSSNSSMNKGGQDAPVITHRTLKTNKAQQKTDAQYNTNSTVAQQNSPQVETTTKKGTTKEDAKIDAKVDAKSQASVAKANTQLDAAKNKAAQVATANANAKVDAAKTKTNAQATAAKANAKVDVKVDAAKNKAAQATAAKANTQAHANASKPYTIVLASAVSEKNASDYIERLKKAGFNDVRMMKKGNMNRVVYSSFSSDTDARNQLSALRNKSSEFASAWIYKIP